MIFDTTFLIDLQREIRRNSPGDAGAFLERLTSERYRIAFVTRMEMAEGYGAAEQSDAELFLASFTTLYPDQETCWRAGHISRALRESGAPIGDHDVWIAALALQNSDTIVTRNTEHFERVASLSLCRY